MNVIHYTPIYFDNFGYQENLLPKYFYIMGHDVSVITCTQTTKKKEKTYTKGSYWIDGVEIIRIKSFCFLSDNLFVTRGLYRELKQKKPDIIFHHDISLTSLLVIVIYKIFHPTCILYVDNHADFFNCHPPKIWFLFYYKFVLQGILKLVTPFVKYFYGVTNGRCDFLSSIFGVPSSKIKLLPIGADTLVANEIIQSKVDIREKYQIPLNDFVVISGGKMGKDKGTDRIINAVVNLRRKGKYISLVLFGKYTDEETKNMSKRSSVIINIGWCDRIQTMELLSMADVAVWPIYHTTLIEDSIAVLTPLILKKTRTTEHLIAGNGYFTEYDSDDEIENKILKLMDEDPIYLRNKCIAKRNEIDYKCIVNQIINDMKD
jgi:glycosyltransferase involved in cell wall biosynthesis